MTVSSRSWASLSDTFINDADPDRLTTPEKQHPHSSPPSAPASIRDNDGDDDVESIAAKLDPMVVEVVGSNEARMREALADPEIANCQQFIANGADTRSAMGVKFMRDGLNKDPEYAKLDTSGKRQFRQKWAKVMMESKLQKKLFTETYQVVDEEKGEYFNLANLIASYGGGTHGRKTAFKHACKALAMRGKWIKFGHMGGGDVVSQDAGHVYRNVDSQLAIV